jgi:hypothetical protein
MRKPLRRKPKHRRPNNLFVRLDDATERLRRELQKQHKCTATELVERSFRMLAACDEAPAA